MARDKIFKIEDSLFSNPTTESKYIIDLGMNEKIIALSDARIKIIDKTFKIDSSHTLDELENELESEHMDDLSVADLFNIAKELNEYVVLNSWFCDTCLIAPNGKHVLYVSEGKLFNEDYSIMFSEDSDLNKVEGLEETLNKAINNFIYIRIS